MRVIVNKVKQFIKTKIALMLFKSNKFSIEQASQFSNLSLYSFMEECKKNKIPIINYDEDELANEMKLISGIECVGIWKDRDITQESIMEEAWRQGIK